MSIYQSDPRRAPDSEFEPGVLGHLVVGSRARLLDARRTPLTIVSIRIEVGFCSMRVDAFEDVGALWDVPFEEIDRYQFWLGSPRANATDIEAFRSAVDRFDRRLEIECDEDERAATNLRLRDEEAQAERWLAANSLFFSAGAVSPNPEERVGDRRLREDLSSYMAHRNLDVIETGFSRQFVSNPYSGEVVKGHRIALAEMGLVPYEGSVVRDPTTFDEPWTISDRTRHIEARLGFVRAMFARIGQSRISLHRGVASRGTIEPPRNRSLVSATFSSAVARSHFDGAEPGWDRVLLSQDVPASRVLMTYLETAAMNDAFKEAEAVLLFDPKNPIF